MINFDTHPTDGDPRQLIDSIDHVRRHLDSMTLLEMMQKLSGEEAVLWSGKVIGFGQYRYRYKTGREGYWPIISFTPSLQSLSINVMGGLASYTTLIKKIGKVKCTETALILYKLSDIDRRALEAFLQAVMDDVQASQNKT